MRAYFLKLLLSATVLSLGATFFVYMLSSPHSATPVNPVVQGFEVDCGDHLQPCWYGIVPGYTSVSVAQRKLLDIRDRFDAINIVERGQETWTLVSGAAAHQCSVNLLFGGTTVDSISIRNCGPFYLGDLMTELGAPTSLRPYNLTFAEQTIIARIPFYRERDECFELSPHTPVLALYLHPPLPPNFRLQAVVWQGFKSYVWYVERAGAVRCQHLAEMPGL